jgi:GNAT superfamily N-acetyltransferase
MAWLQDDGRRKGLIRINIAAPCDASAVATLRNATTADLTTRHGPGHWSTTVSPESVARGIATSHVIVALLNEQIIGTTRLVKKKPWAIDPTFFSPSNKPIHLVDMAVHPAHQRIGVGRLVLEAARATAAELGADAIRLDAYDAPAGAGPFYERCGYTPRGGKSYRGVPLRYYELLLREPRLD